MKDDECDTVALMFCRRHVYEHNGGEVDQRYLDASGDKSVRLKQHIHETKEAAHKLLGSLLKMARNIHNGFHEIFPPISGPIKAYEGKNARMAKLDQSGAAKPPELKSKPPDELARDVPDGSDPA